VIFEKTLENDTAGGIGFIFRTGGSLFVYIDLFSYSLVSFCIHRALFEYVGLFSENDTAGGIECISILCRRRQNPMHAREETCIYEVFF